MKAGVPPWLRELFDGSVFKVEIDPADPRFELITIRTPSNTNVGGPALPICDLRGEPARLRFARFLLGRCAGMLAETGAAPKIIKVLFDERAKYQEGD